jgi:hypothetical protein
MIKAVILGLLFASQTVAPKTGTLSLKLTTLDVSVKPGGKIMVRVTTTNESGHLITFENTGSDCDYAFRVLTDTGAPAPETQHKKQLACSPGSGESADTGMDVVVTLKPGESSSEDVLITDLYDISAPGTYAVRVVRTFPKVGRSRSNDVTVKVTR